MIEHLILLTLLFAIISIGSQVALERIRTKKEQREFIERAKTNARIMAHVAQMQHGRIRDE